MNKNTLHIFILMLFSVFFLGCTPSTPSASSKSVLPISGPSLCKSIGNPDLFINAIRGKKESSFELDAAMMEIIFNDITIMFDKNVILTNDIFYAESSYDSEDFLLDLLPLNPLYALFSAATSGGKASELTTIKLNQKTNTVKLDGMIFNKAIYDCEPNGVKTQLNKLNMNKTKDTDTNTWKMDL